MSDDDVDATRYAWRAWFGAGQKYQTRCGPRAGSHPGVVITFERPAEQGQWTNLRFPVSMRIVREQHRKSATEN